VLAEPGGELDATLDPTASNNGVSQRSARFAAIAEMVGGGDSEGALKAFFEAIEGDGAWGRLAAVPKQQLRDNVFTLIGQAGENRKPYAKAEAQSIETPTLFVGGTATKGTLPAVLRALAANVPGAKIAMIEGAGHWMFEHAPEQFSAIVTEFLRD
jgi:esterase